MANIAFLGTGLLGSGMVEGMLQRGESVTVWNRTESKARALERFGAKVATTPAGAAAGASRVHMTLSDDAAVDAVIEQFVDRLAPGAVILDHTTVSPAGTIVRDRRMRERGVKFLHAPVFMSPDMARQAQGLLMSSGAEAIFNEARVPLQQMSSEAWYLGDDPGRAASYKLFGNSMLLTITAGLGDIFAMAQNLGIAAPDAVQVFSKFAAGNTIKFRGDKMARGDFSATFELTMARKDIRLMIEAAGQQPMTVLPAIAHRMDKAIAAGFGAEDLAAITKAPA